MEQAPQPKSAAFTPIEVALESGKTYYYCACGLSAGQPFCDGSHKGSGITPLAFSTEKEGKAWLCQCKHTKNPPYCDGTHKTLKENMKG